MSGFVYSEKPIKIDRGEGPHLYDETGTEYLDFGASYACVPLGHAHPAVTRAAADQLEELTFVQCSYPVDIRQATYDRIAAGAPGDLSNVWLCNSGTEANEAAIKFARSATGRSKIVSTMRGFHGRTMGSLALTWKSKYRDPFEPVMPDVEFVPYGDADALTDAIDEETAAVFLEPVQGEGGVNPASTGYLEHAREVTAAHGSALVFDEVQTGVGRTGELWAAHRAGVEPDILTAAKGIANGLPMGATVVADWIAEDCGPHGSTFSGGPVIAAAADATLRTVTEESLPENAASIGTMIREGVSDLDGVREVRGEGLLIGIEVRKGSNALVRDLAMDHQILTLPAGRSVLRLLPPLTITEDHAEQFVESFVEVLE